MNFPASLIIIKSTLVYRGTGKGYEEYSDIEIQQMVGRAGRPGYYLKYRLAETGTAIIMTDQLNVKKYKDLDRISDAVIK